VLFYGNLSLNLGSAIGITASSHLTKTDLAGCDEAMKECSVPDPDLEIID
jgi:hypothetical protein